MSDCAMPCSRPFRVQGGGSLLLVLLFMVLLGAAGGLGYGIARHRAAGTDAAAHRQGHTAETRLAAARQALLAYAVGQDGMLPPNNLAFRLGGLPLPDTVFTGWAARTRCLHANGRGGLLNTGMAMRCLGRLPAKELGLPLPQRLLGDDPAGGELWYAISANLADVACLPFLTRDLLALPVASGGMSGCNNNQVNPAALPHPWLRVRNAAGQTIATRVAAVLLFPGPVRFGQTRPALAYGTALNADILRQYLEEENAQLTDVFREATVAPDAAEMNDRLLYITVDELFEAAAQRVRLDLQAALRAYYHASAQVPAQRHFPYASFASRPPLPLSNLHEGFVPLPYHSGISDEVSTVGSSFCQCSRSRCLCRLAEGNGVAVLRGNAPQFFSSSSGSCRTDDPHTCVCSGLSGGSCILSNPVSNQPLHAARVESLFGYFVASSMSASDSCGNLNGRTSSYTAHRDCSCPSNTVASDAHPRSCALGMPQWFEEGGWRDAFIYILAPRCSQAGSSASPAGCAPPFGLMAGTRRAAALLIDAGIPLAKTHCRGSLRTQQMRPSSDLCDYLDSDRNTRADGRYDPVGLAPRVAPGAASPYNDRVYVVPLDTLP